MKQRKNLPLNHKASANIHVTAKRIHDLKGFKPTEQHQLNTTQMAPIAKVAYTARRLPRLVVSSLRALHVSNIKASYLEVVL